MWKVGNIAPVSVLGVDSAYGFNITTERVGTLTVIGNIFRTGDRRNVRKREPEA